MVSKLVLEREIHKKGEGVERTVIQNETLLYYYLFESTIVVQKMPIYKDVCNKHQTTRLFKVEPDELLMLKWP